MKKTFFLLACATALLISCKGGSNLDYASAKAVAENCIKAIDAGDYAAVSDKYYSSEFSGSNPENLKSKFDRLRATTGQVVSFTLKDSSQTAEIGEEAKIVLTYEVKHSNTNTTEQFVITAPSGNYRIVNHSVNN